MPNTRCLGTDLQETITYMFNASLTCIPLHQVEKSILVNQSAVMDMWKMERTHGWNGRWWLWRLICSQSFEDCFSRGFTGNCPLIRIALSALSIWRRRRRQTHSAAKTGLFAILVPDSVIHFDDEDFQTT